MKKTQFFDDLFLTPRFFLVWGSTSMLFLGSFFFPVLMSFAKAITVLLIIITLLDYGLLFFTRRMLFISRKVPDLLSNGDENVVNLQINNQLQIPLQITIIDELPQQFQQRDFAIRTRISPLTKTAYTYTLRPTQRGEYAFGDIHVYASTFIRFTERRFTAMQEQTVKVYPSFTQLRHFQIHAMPDQHAQSGGRRQYRRGASTEFDHIKEYTRGDDARTINWKASARRNQLMVNAYMDEKSQQIYCLIDMGRLMKMPFQDLSLLDYSINAALMFSYVALQKDDKIGLITFGEKVKDLVQPSKVKKHFNLILETLYKQETRFLESNFADVHALVNRKAGQRSLLILFTNFETYTGFERQLPYLRALNQRHLLCVILFENSEVNRIHELRGDTLEDIYIKTIADKFIHEKKMIIRELKKHGILVIYTPPQKLTVNVVNKYLELKAKQYI
ncbi:MAG: DUF58 domain-containing protein [Chitinophagaceae bacterium]|nr:DUF58 domain-containing protein [Chitinophagaceae bacterium]